MNRTLARLLRLAGFSLTPPKTWQGRHLRRANRAVLVLTLLYLGLQIFPQALFAHSVTASDITFYSRQPLPADVAVCAARVRGLLRHSELAAPERAERVFVCDEPWLFALFSPASAKSFAFSVPLTDNVFVAMADVSTDTARSYAVVYNTRILSGVIAHEITHGLIRRRLGWLRSTLLPAWVVEGYCDYVAGEGSFPEMTGRYLMASGRTNPTPSFRYFEYRQMVRYLLGERHLSFAQMIERADDFAAVEAQTQRSMRGHAGQ